jgi:hypothetical protein
MPSAEWRRRRLWKISRYSKIPLTSSICGSPSVSVEKLDLHPDSRRALGLLTFTDLDSAADARHDPVRQLRRAQDLGVSEKQSRNQERRSCKAKKTAIAAGEVGFRKATTGTFAMAHHLLNPRRPANPNDP